MGSMPRRSVPSGAYIISERASLVLEAFLGTCVGVSLCDRQAGVGGLIHLLLPEPTSSHLFDCPETYASTGLPLFIEAICRAGASKERLEACVAGGALVGPVAERDLVLDIGGRTADVVGGILDREGISIHKSETGGYFSCCLALDLRTFETAIVPLGKPSEGLTAGEFQKPSAERLQRVIESVKPIPQVTMKVIRMLNDDHFSLHDIAEEVRQDQVLTARAIRLCNSALFGLKKQTDSIDQALVMLGEKRFLQLALSASMKEFYDEVTGGYSLCKGGLHQHALGTAMIAERLSRLRGGVPSDLAYTAGLLHDIGKVVLDQYIAPVYPYFYRRTQEDGVDLITIEDEVFDLSHAEAGGRLAETWGLPENLTQAIRYHHTPEQAEVHPELTYLIYLADLLCSRFLAGQSLERINTAALGSRLRRMGFLPEQFPFIVDHIPRQLFQEA